MWMLWFWIEGYVETLHEEDASKLDLKEML
jgi:hypothetical protein